MRQATRAKRSRCGVQAPFKRLSIGPAALGGFGSRCDGDRCLGDRRPSHPCTPREARKDRAPHHRGTRGPAVSSKGARGRPRTNPTPGRIGAALVNIEERGIASSLASVVETKGA
jgi:hypothetical protein